MTALTIRRRKYLFKKPSSTVSWVAVIVASLVGAGAYLFLSRPTVSVSARTETSESGPTLLVDVQASRSAEGFELPQLRISAPIAKGRTKIKVPLGELPPGENELVYLVREPWYLPDQQGVFSFERATEDVNYVVRVEAGDPGEAWVSISGDPGNHVLLFDPSGNVQLSGRQSDLADAGGVARVRFSEEDMRASRDPSGAVKVFLSVTSPTGEVSDREVTLRKAPEGTVKATVLFPAPGTVTDRANVRVRILTEAGTLVRFGDDPKGLRGPRVEYEWRVPGEGKQVLNYEARAAGLRPALGTIEITRRTQEPAETPAPGGQALRISYPELARGADALSGESVEVAGSVLAPPAATGAKELLELGSGDEARRGEIAVVYDRDEFPPLETGDRVIMSARVEGKQRLRTASGRVQEIPRLHAAEITTRSLAKSAADFESRYANLVARFWPVEEKATAAVPASPARALASQKPWPPAPAAQEREPVLASELVSGRGDKPPEFPEPALPAPEAVAAGEAPKEEAPPETLPESGAADAETPAPAVAAGSLYEMPEEAGEGAATGEDEAGASEEEEPEPPPPPVLGQTAWERDMALESELLGRGLGGVQIYRKGRSIRLRGSVDDDRELRTVYQFMSDKGFGEVDYGVEIR